MLLKTTEPIRRRWNRVLLRGFWGLLLLSVLIECLYLSFTDMPAEPFVRLYIVRPTVLMLLVIVLAEAGVRFLPKHHDYLIISASALLGVILATIHAQLEYLLFLLFLPVMIGTFYFQYKKLLYAVCNIAVMLVVQYAFGQEGLRQLGAPGLITVSIMLAAFGALAFGVLARGQELMTELRTSYDSNQELLIRSVMMDRLAKTDALTDTFNHMASHEFMDKMTEHADKTNLALHLIVMDIDNFKTVNDSYGHRAGDEVLRRVAAIASSLADGNDIVGRYGGEEFIVLLVDRTDEEAAEFANAMRAAIAQAGHEALDGNRVTVSIGIARYVPKMGKERWFRDADDALYQAKSEGRNRVVFSPVRPSTQTSSPA